MTLFPAAGCSALLARPGACPESWLSSSQQRSKQGPPIPSVRMGLEPSGLLSAPEVYPLLWGPSWEQPGGAPSARDLSATAATVLLGSPRSLLGRYGHTWDTKDGKLGGDVNGPSQTNPEIHSGGAEQRHRGWAKEAEGVGRKKKGDEAPPNTLERAPTTEVTPLLPLPPPPEIPLYFPPSCPSTPKTLAAVRLTAPVGLPGSDAQPVSPLPD